MKDYYQKSMRALQLAGMSERTQQCYTRSVRMLADYYGKTADKVSEEELQDYFLHRRNVDKWSAATMRICYSGIKFFFINVLQRDWHTLELIRAKREQRVPTVLSLDEIRSIRPSAPASRVSSSSPPMFLKWPFQTAGSYKSKIEKSFSNTVKIKATGGAL